VKLTGHTYPCNSLTNFTYEVHAMTGNGNYVKSEQASWIWMQKITVKKNVVPKIIKLGFIVETILYSIVHILGYILSYILDS
jgi:hypothetical protein